MNELERLGVDVGGVLIDRINDGTDTSFLGGNYLQTTAVPGAFEALQRLGAERFGRAIHLVSKCGEATEAKTRAWLGHHEFYEATGIPADQLHFCRKRQEKAPICLGLGISHFIDDRLEVLGYLESVPNRYLFRPDPREVERHRGHLAKVIRVDGWDEVLAALGANSPRRTAFD